MKNRERFQAHMRFQPVDRAPIWELVYYWLPTLERWHREGMPADVVGVDLSGDPMAAMEWQVRHEEYFGLDRVARCDCNTQALATEPVVLEKRGAERLIRDHWGRHIRSWSDGSQPPRMERAAIAGTDDWSAVKERLQMVPERVSEDTSSRVRKYIDEDVVVFSVIKGAYWISRELFGEEGVLYALYDMPEVVSELSRTLADLHGKVMEYLLKGAAVDFVVIDEDVCYKGGSLISEGHLREFYEPYYRRVVSVLREQCVPFVFLDTDGNHTDLVSAYREFGFDGFLPLEVRAGMDPTMLRSSHPDVLMIGGVDKNLLSGPEEALRSHVRERMDIARRGGYILSTDHQVPPSVSLERYRAYVEILKQESGK